MITAHEEYIDLASYMIILYYGHLYIIMSFVIVHMQCRV